MKKFIWFELAFLFLLTACKVGWHYHLYPKEDKVDEFYINKNLDCVIVMSGAYGKFNLKKIFYLIKIIALYMALITLF